MDRYTYNLLYNIPTNLQARYDLFCVKSAIKPQPTNQPVVLGLVFPYQAKRLSWEMSPK